MTNTTVINYNYSSLKFKKKLKALEIYYTISNIIKHGRDVVNVIGENVDKIDNFKNDTLDFLEKYIPLDTTEVNDIYERNLEKVKFGLNFAHEKFYIIEDISNKINEKDFLGIYEEYKEEGIELYNIIKNKIDEKFFNENVDHEHFQIIKNVINQVKAGKKHIEVNGISIGEESIYTIGETITNESTDDMLDIILSDIDDYEISNKYIAPPSPLAIMLQSYGINIDFLDFEKYNKYKLNLFIESITGAFNEHLIEDAIDKTYNAPAAVVFLSGTYELINIVNLFRSNQINEDEFYNLIAQNGIDVSGLSLGAIVGQALIPAPVIGALIGTMAMSTALKMGELVFNERERMILNRYEQDIQDFVDSLEKEHQKLYDELATKYNEITNLQETAFDLKLNIELNFMASIQLADKVGVREDKVLRNLKEIDDFFLM